MVNKKQLSIESFLSRVDVSDLLEEGKPFLQEVLTKGQQDFLVESNKRWFLSSNGVMDQSRGFVSKKYASLWINSLGYELDWRAGYIFRLKDANQDIEVVSSKGARAK